MSTSLPVINLMGPTASGKTALACELYEQGQFELISVDSALIYQDMDIGTAKPTKEEQVQYPHHLIDIITPLAKRLSRGWYTDYAITNGATEKFTISLHIS